MHRSQNASWHRKERKSILELELKLLEAKMSERDCERVELRRMMEAALSGSIPQYSRSLSGCVQKIIISRTWAVSRSCLVLLKAENSLIKEALGSAALDIMVRNSAVRLREALRHMLS